MKFFIILQFVLLIFMLFHDWIPIPPFNDVETLKKTDGNKKRLLGSCIHGATVLIPLFITLAYYPQTILPKSAATTIFGFYFCLTLGTILSWWVPYCVGSSTQHKYRFIKFKQTHHFLPARGDNVVPNTLHVVLHLQVWVCLIISSKLLLNSF